MLIETIKSGNDKAVTICEGQVVFIQPEYPHISLFCLFLFDDDIMKTFSLIVDDYRIKIKNFVCRITLVSLLKDIVVSDKYLIQVQDQLAQVAATGPHVFALGHEKDSLLFTSHRMHVWLSMTIEPFIDGLDLFGIFGETTL